MHKLAAAALFLALFQPSIHAALFFQFDGQVSSMNPASTAYPGVQVGTPVSGVFTIDPIAPDSNPGNPNFGLFTSARFTFSGQLGSHSFELPANAANNLTVDNNQISSQDFLVFRGPSPLELTFFDPTGLTLTSDAVPTSASIYDAFPSVDLFASSGPGGGFGQYVFDVTVVQIPEPSGGLLLLGLYFLGRFGFLRAKS